MLGPGALSDHQAAFSLTLEASGPSTPTAQPPMGPVPGVVPGHLPVGAGLGQEDTQGGDTPSSELLSKCLLTGGLEESCATVC